MDLRKIPANEWGHVQTADERRVMLLGRYSSEGKDCVALLIDSGRRKFVSECEETVNLLIPVPRKVRVNRWMNVFDRTGRDGTPVTSFHDTKYDADGWAKHHDHCHRIACIEIDREVTEGEGL